MYMSAIVLIGDNKTNHTWSEQLEVIFISTYTEALVPYRAHRELSPIDVGPENGNLVYPVYAIRALHIRHAPKQGPAIPIS